MDDPCIDMYPLHHGIAAGCLDDVALALQSLLVNLWEVVLNADVVGEELVVETREANRITQGTTKTQNIQYHLKQIMIIKKFDNITSNNYYKPVSVPQA